MKARTFLLALLLDAVSAPAWADQCPPTADDFTTWTWIGSAESGDAWASARWCATSSMPDVVGGIVDHMGLVPLWPYWWQTMMSDVAMCDPDTWSARFANGAWAADHLGYNRDQDTFVHFASPGAVMPEGNSVTFWLGEYVRYYTRSDGWVPQCLASGDGPGPGDGFTYAANPTSNAPLKLYFPWFWNMTAMDRASVLVHEASHEFAGHLPDSACANGASCDDAFMNANAQTFTIIFNAQAIDAYTRLEGSRQLWIANYGNDVCGYVPLVPDLQRFYQVYTMRHRLETVFQNVPPQSSWPASAFIDDTAGSIYDLADEPGGWPGKAYRVDMVNGARWPCGKVCNEDDYRFDLGGPKACNETYQPGNVAVNAHNRTLCASLNAEVGAGVTPAQHHALENRLILESNNCLSGVSDAYLQQVCQQLSSQATNVAQIEAGWPVPDAGYGFDAAGAIASCQRTFCASKHAAAWDTTGAAACFEWDDPYGCLELDCGDLSAIAAAKGRESYEYLAALVCRASELNRELAGIGRATGGCAAQFEECLVRERYLPKWEAQLAGGPCWAGTSAATSPGDPLYTAHRASIGATSAERFVAADRGPALLGSRCMMEQVSCEAQQAALRAALAKMIHDKARTRPVWKKPVVPDPWEKLEGRFDREVIQEMDALGELLGTPGADVGPLARFDRIQRLVASPEATLAIAEVAGRDVFLAAGGARFAQGVFAPATLARFAGGAADPYGLGGERGAELDALAALALALDSAAGRQALAAAPSLGGAAYYGHMTAMLGAKTGAELRAAFQAFAADVAGR